MKQIENTILLIAFMLMCFGMGYILKGMEFIALILQEFGIPLSFIVANGLVSIITIGSCFLLVIAIILSFFDEKRNP